MSAGTAPTRTAPVVRRRDTERVKRLLADLDLIVAPVLILLGAGALALFLGTAELDSIEIDALRYEEIAQQFRAHIGLTAWSTLFVVLIAIPAGVLITRPFARKLEPYMLGLGNAGQAIPAYGLLVLLLPALGTGFRTAVIALIVYSSLPVLRNTMVGLQQVDSDVIEAAKGMGLTRKQVLRRIELPLAVPVILAGVRTALVINVGTAALAFLIGGGGLGESINTGLKLQRTPIILTGAGLTALLALTIDWIAGLAERFLRPRGLR